MAFKKSSAFGLIEVSYLLLVFSFLTVGALLLINHRSNNVVSRYEKTQLTLNELERALTVFLARNARLPCPSDISLAPNNSNFGKEAIDFDQGRATTCSLSSSGITSYSINEVYTLFQGTVPVRALNISDEFMFDSWNSKIEYAVIMPFAYPSPEESFYITIRNRNSNTLSNTASYFLVSHGQNKKTAYDRFGTQFGESEHKSENRNSLDYATGRVRIHATTGTAHNNFDDITRYKEQEDLISDCNAITADKCEEALQPEEEESLFGGEGTGGGGSNGEDDD